MRYLHSNFFKYISTTFGTRCNQLLKSWVKQQKWIINNKIKVTFLKVCIKYSIIPIHLQNITGNKLIISDHNCNRKLKHIRHVFATKLLKIKLNDAYKTLNRTHIEVYRLVKEISKHLPIYVYSNFFKRQESALHSLFAHEKHRIFKKINNLIQKQIYTDIKNTTSIQYYSSLSALNNKLKLTNITNIKNPPVFPSHPTNSNEGVIINIESASFINNISRSSLISKRQNWLGLS